LVLPVKDEAMGWAFPFSIFKSGTRDVLQQRGGIHGCFG